jgi:hypothetical protein
MPIINTKAKVDCLPFFKKGEKVIVIPILYEEDTMIVRQMNGLFNEEGVFLRYAPNMDVEKFEDGREIRKVHDAVYAPEGSYKDSYFITENGFEHPSSHLGFKKYQDVLEKI